jgi:hypothetical protein
MPASRASRLHCVTNVYQHRRYCKHYALLRPLASIYDCCLCLRLRLRFESLGLRGRIAVAEVADLPSLKCSSHWSLGLYPASVEHYTLLRPLASIYDCYIFLTLCSYESQPTLCSLETRPIRFVITHVTNRYACCSTCRSGAQ